ncbi:low-complexity protein [Clostridium beijerinckii]|uniref:Low-complexity protein n=1 Tax=Clostridium beijerinckii TaxID=1520 RepID=A0A0B5QS80_CLOBE|nr:pentapeptide repeat-containing protein [Clostridium beijerinckii]AJH00943.1 low-complexity protein [Clostridium beijerinckii]
MSEKLRKHLDYIFTPYNDLMAVKEIKEELFIDLQEKLNDLKNNGYDEDEAYNKTIESIGEVSEIVESINSKTRELQQLVGIDFSKSPLEDSDFKGVEIVNGKFNYSALKNADFSNSNLRDSSFKCSDLSNANFDGANLSGAKINKASLKGASFKDTILDNTDFSYSDLSGLCFDGQKLNGTIFDYSGLRGTSFKNAILRNVSFKTEVKKAIFDGATMDKLTYAILKGFKAKLDNVTII